MNSFAAPAGPGSVRRNIGFFPVAFAPSIALFDFLVAFAAVGGLSLAVLYGLPLHTKDFALSDLKTLYASIWSFVHGQNAYSTASIQAVFRANGIVEPATWYGHAAVYPPMTLALLAPLALLPMVPAAILAAILSAAMMAMAVACLMQDARERYPLAGGGWWQRIAPIVIAVLCAVGPLLSFALTMGNLSVASASLAIVAYLRRAHQSPWLSATMLAVAFLLKPHLALWICIAMLVLPDRRTRNVAGLSVLLGGSFLWIVGIAMAATHTFSLQMHGFAATLHAETSGIASMSPFSREALPAVSQIPSLQSLLGFWISNSYLLNAMTAILLLALAIPLLRLTNAAIAQKSSALAVGAWCAFGLLATYHRAHDAVILLILLPWLMENIRYSPRDIRPWTVFALYIAMSIGPAPATIAAHTAGVTGFLLLRQVAIANAALLGVLISLLARPPMRAHARPLLLPSANPRYTEHSALSA